MDLVDEMMWEDIADEQGLFVSLESAGLVDGYIGDTVCAAQKIYYDEEAN